MKEEVNKVVDKKRNNENSENLEDYEVKFDLEIIDEQNELVNVCNNSIENHLHSSPLIESRSIWEGDN